ncbi:MAG: UDP-N-acetylglucosamine 2-epimerase (non-hydrolyzing) [ANME-2 cluster archaeon]|nr:UDP-N-acetylglucosamine 2-epimerase (non-hydrolyzing) [ANME-2 cluster archaeon]
MRLAIILGTRPEIIKMAPIITELQKRNEDFFQIHTGQHYSYEMDRIFFEELELPQPEFNLDVGSGTHGTQTGKMLEGIEAVLQKEMPDIVLVQGDTNTVMAGALASVKLGIKVGHVEAGLRSFDRSMPEEINRIIADHISDYLFAPTEGSKKNLLKEGIPDEKIFVTGNTVVDAVYKNLELSNRKMDVMNILDLAKKDYILVTIHRQENVDKKDRFQGILQGLAEISSRNKVTIVYPIHPRTKKMIGMLHLQDELNKINNLIMCEPFGYLEFLQLEKNAKLIATDSGGIQEEACILGVPCITLRDNTERPETIETGANLLAGIEPLSIAKAANEMMVKRTSWKNPFGDGNSSDRILNIIMKSKKLHHGEVKAIK